MGCWKKIIKKNIHIKVVISHAPKNQILQKLTYPIPSEEFEWADDGIKLDGTLFKLEAEEMAIVLFKGEKNPFLLTDKKIHVLYEAPVFTTNLLKF